MANSGEAGQAMQQVASAFAWVPILGDMVYAGFEDASDVLTGFDRDVTYYYVPKNGYDGIKDVSTETMLFVTTPVSGDIYAKNTNFAYLELPNSAINVSGNSKYTYVTQDKTISSTSFAEVQTALGPYIYGIPGYYKYYPVYEFNIADTLLSQECTSVMYIDETGKQTGRVSNVRQILAMTSIVFEDAEDKDFDDGTGTGDIIYNPEIDEADFWEVLADKCKWLNDMAHKFLDGVIENLADFIEETFNINIPDVLLTANARGLTFTEILYSTAAYWASHDIYMSYAATPESDIALDSCGARIIAQDYRFATGTPYDPVCKYIDFDIAYEDVDSFGNAIPLYSGGAKFYTIEMEYGTSYGYLNSLCAEDWDFGNPTTGDGSAYYEHDADYDAYVSSIVYEFYHYYELKQAAGDEIINAITYYYASSAGDPSATLDRGKFNFSFNFGDLNFQGLLEYMGTGSGYYNTEGVRINLDEWNKGGRDDLINTNGIYEWAPSFNPDLKIPMVIVDGVAYVGTGNFVCRRCPIGSTELEGSNIVQYINDDGNIDTAPVSELVIMGNFIERVYAGYGEKDQDEIDLFGSYIEFAIAESIRYNGVQPDIQYSILACTGHPRIVFALQTYTFGLEGTYEDDGNFATSQRAPETYIDRDGNEQIVQTLFDRVDRSAFCETIELKFAKYGVFYQGWTALQSPIDTLNNLLLVFDPTTYGDGSLDTWPRDSADTVAANRERARVLYDRDWSVEYGLNITDSAFFNKVLLDQETKNTMCSYLFKTFAEPDVDVDEDGNLVPKYQPYISDERYDIVWTAMNYVGKISYLPNANVEDYIMPGGDGVRLNEGGQPAPPMSLDGPTFIAWLFASRGINVGVGNTNITLESFTSASNTQVMVVNSSAQWVPGDIIIYHDARGEESIGIFLFYADTARQEAYVIGERWQGRDDSISLTGEMRADILAYGSDIINLYAQDVGCVSLSRISLTATPGMYDYNCTRIVPAGYEGMTFVPGSAAAAPVGGTGSMIPTDEQIEDEGRDEYHIDDPIYREP